MIAAVAAAAAVVAVLARRRPGRSSRTSRAGTSRPGCGRSPRRTRCESLAAERRDAVGRNQEAGRAAVFLGRVVDDRQVEHRHALDLEDRVPQQRVVIDVQDDRVGVQIPARRRLHAGAEAAVGDPVFLRCRSSRPSRRRSRRRSPGRSSAAATMPPAGAACRGGCMLAMPHAL